MAALIAVVLAAIAFVVGLRWLARRELRPVPVLVSGEVPPAADWMQRALVTTAVTHGGVYRWADVGQAGLLSGHHGDVRFETAGIQLSADLQPHTHLTTLDSSRPLRVLVDMPEFPRRPGIQGLVLGRYPLKSALVMRRALRTNIRDEARAAGAKAQLVNRIKTSTIAGIGGVILALALIATAAPLVLAQLDATAVNPPPTRSAPSKPPTKPPASATACPAANKSRTAPQRSASGTKETGCALAEVVRLAYLKRAPRGKPVTLTVNRPKTKQKYTLKCQGGALVTCTDRKITVYLY